MKYTVVVAFHVWADSPEDAQDLVGGTLDGIQHHYTMQDGRITAAIANSSIQRVQQVHPLPEGN
jgi:hypothetical protein